MDVCRVEKKSSHLTCTFPAEVQQGDALPPCSCSQKSTSVLSTVLFCAMLVAFLCTQAPSALCETPLLSALPLSCSHPTSHLITP